MSSAQGWSGRVMATVLCLIAGADALGYSPAVNYQLQCRGCHGADGSGEPGRVPSIRRSLWTMTRQAWRRQRLFQFPGVAQSALDDQDLASLLNWMTLTLAERESGRFEPFTSQEIRTYRDRIRAAK